MFENDSGEHHKSNYSDKKNLSDSYSSEDGQSHKVRRKKKRRGIKIILIIFLKNCLLHA